MRENCYFVFGVWDFTWYSFRSLGYRRQTLPESAPFPFFLTHFLHSLPLRLKAIVPSFPREHLSSFSTYSHPPVFVLDHPFSLSPLLYHSSAYNTTTATGTTASPKTFIEHTHGPVCRQVKGAQGWTANTVTWNGTEHLFIFSYTLANGELL